MRTLQQSRKFLAEADQILNARLLYRDFRAEADACSTARMLKNILWIGITILLGYAEIIFVMGGGR